MRKNIFIVHGISGIADAGWAVWLKDELEKQGNEVVLPMFPTRDEATPEKWEAILNNYKNKISTETIFVAHSLGTVTTVNYIAKNKLKIDKAVFVAGMGNLFFRKELEKSHNDNLVKITKPFIPSAESKEKFKELVNEIYCFYSDNDHILPVENLQKFAQDLNAKEILLPNRGHFGRKMNCQKIPEVLELVIKLLK